MVAEAEADDSSVVTAVLGGRVDSYRLIGYDNRILAKEDFNNDTKDAGELGVGDSVTALYEIVPQGIEGPNAGVDALRYQAQPAPAPTLAPSANAEILTVKLRYKDPLDSTSKLLSVPAENKSVDIKEASEDLRFAAAVAEFGMLLRDSQYKGSSSLEQVKSLAQSAKSIDPNGDRGEFIRLVDMARALKMVGR